MELNREGSGLDQEQAAGRFTLTRYILYLLPVIGFIGTVEGISKALMNISRVLPMVKNLDGFMSNLTSVTSALQIAFDSTLLALFLSAALMLVQTLVFRRSDNSWHGHKPFAGPRRVVQMNWVTSNRTAAWQQFRHRVSAAVKRFAPRASAA